MTLAWLHDLDPIIFRISGDFAIRWYGVAYAIGFVLAWMQLVWLAKRNAGSIPAHRVADAMMILIIGVILGGRLGYILVYDRELLTLFSKDPPWWGALMINKGGMAFHGAVVGVVLAAWHISRGFRDDKGPRTGKMPLPHVFDLVAFVAPAGLMLGRLANFINGELLGQIVALPGKPAPWWAIKFPQEIASGHPVSYTTEQAARLANLLDRFGQDKHGPRWASEQLLAAIQSRSTPNRDALIAEVSQLVSSRHPSQLYQAFAEGPILAAVLWILWARPRRPGVIAAAFLITYGILRVVIEQFFRLPDPGLASPHIWGFSRGQWLSAAMIAFGLISLALIRRAARATPEAPRLGGWHT